MSGPSPREKPPKRAVKNDLTKYSQELRKLFSNKKFINEYNKNRLSIMIALLLGEDPKKAQEVNDFLNRLREALERGEGLRKIRYDKKSNKV